LLVEDDASDTRLAVMALKRANARLQIHTVKNGADAIAFLQSEPPFEKRSRPDMVVLDLNLPGVDGREVLTMMKDIKELNNIPVIVLSTSSYEKDIEYCQKMNVSAYLTKPAYFEEYDKLIKQVERICSDRQISFA
jgi:CheY-like chemotaxis protein